MGRYENTYHRALIRGHGIFVLFLLEQYINSEKIDFSVLFERTYEGIDMDDMVGYTSPEMQLILPYLFKLWPYRQSFLASCKYFSICRCPCFSELNVNAVGQRRMMIWINTMEAAAGIFLHNQIGI